VVRQNEFVAGQPTTRLPRTEPVDSAARRAAEFQALQRSRGNAYVQRALDSIGHPGDDYEREAERVAGGHPAVAPDGDSAIDSLPPKLEPRIHVDVHAADAARSLGARALTVGRDIYFGAGEFQPHTTAGRRLLTHELTHVAQQAVGGAPHVQLQERSAEGHAHETSVPGGARPDSPANLPQRRYRVFIVGSPGQAEVSVHHPFQFADAAAQQGNDPSTVWLVERTGYELGEVPLEGVITRAGRAHVFWITTSTPLASLLRQFPPESIGSLDAYSHGVPGLLALRHGWPGQDDYGLTVSEARSLSPDAFASDSTVSFDSCNSATAGGEESIAQSVATSTQRPVRAWIGRTSYRDVNRGTGGVAPSEIWPSGGSFDVKELGSQLLGRHPERVTVAPERSPGNFEGGYEITARLPRTRRFPVASGQTVHLTISADSDFVGMQGLPVFVVLNREQRWIDDEVGASGRVDVGSSTTIEWPALEEGTYYLEIFHLHGVLVTGTVSVRVR